VHLKAPGMAMVGLAGLMIAVLQRLGRALAPLARTHRA
jgi:hypothetical protein